MTAWFSATMFSSMLSRHSCDDAFNCCELFASSIFSLEMEVQYPRSETEHGLPPVTAGVFVDESNRMKSVG